jgi:iduronate 2-sulfatase
MRPSLGAYGQPAISPHLDAFAKQSTLFQSAYVQVAWCSPSRNSFLSGRRPDRTHIWTTPGTEPGKGFRAHGPDWLTLPGYFKAAGYIVTAGGKVFHPDEPSDNDPISWTDSPRCPAGSDQGTSSGGGGDGPCTYWKYSFGGYDVCKQVANSSACPHCMGSPGWCSILDTEKTADETTAAVMTQRLRDIEASTTTRPFFMAVGFLKPHLPYAAPARYYAAVDKKWDPVSGAGFPIANASALQMPVGAPRLAWYDYFLSLKDRSGVEYCHNSALKMSQCRKTAMQGHVSMADAFAVAPLRALARGYAAAISLVDEQFGKVLGALDELGLAEKTVVMFVGDHGQNLGEHNTFSKMTLYETNLRAPMIVRAPGGKPGQVIATPVEFLDIYRTLVSLAGLAAPATGTGNVEGVDLAPLVLGAPAVMPPAAAYSQVTRCRASYDKEVGPCSGEFGLSNASQFDWMGMSVRTATHRYVEWRNWSGAALAPVWSGAPAAVELYTHEAGDGGFDSYVNGEAVNIAGEVVNRALVEMLAVQIRNVFQVA